MDGAKRGIGADSDYRLAKSLGISRQVVSAWRCGTKMPDLLHIRIMADWAGLDFGQVVAELERERAERAGRATEAATWRTWLEKAASVAAALVMGAGLIGPSPADASAVSRGSGGSGAPAHSVYFVKLTQRKRRGARQTGGLAFA